MIKNTKRSKKSKNKMIIGTAAGIALVSAVVTTVSVYATANSRTTIQADANNEFTESFLKSKFINSILFNNGEDIIFDEFTVRNNIDKVLIDTISNNELFKINGHEKRDIILRTKYAIKDEHTLYVNCMWNLRKSGNPSTEKFSIKIVE